MLIKIRHWIRLVWKKCPVLMVDMKKNPHEELKLFVFCCQANNLLGYHLVLETYFTGSFKIKHTNLVTIQTIDVSEMKWTYLLWHYFMTISGHFFANKTKVRTNSLRCETCLNPNWIKNYDIKHNFFLLHTEIEKIVSIQQ